MILFFKLFKFLSLNIRSVSSANSVVSSLLGAGHLSREGRVAALRRSLEGLRGILPAVRICSKLLNKQSIMVLAAVVRVKSRFHFSSSCCQKSLLLTKCSFYSIVVCGLRWTTSKDNDQESKSINVVDFKEILSALLKYFSVQIKSKI